MQYCTSVFINIQKFPYIISKTLKYLVFKFLLQITRSNFFYLKFELFYFTIGTILGALSLFCCGKCRHEKVSRGVKYGFVAAILQIVTAVFIVGWIYSIYYGVTMVQDSCKISIYNVQYDVNHACIIYQ